MSENLRKFKKEIAIDMRKHGNSLSEIERAVHIPITTLSYWLKSVNISNDQHAILNNKRTLFAIENAKKRKNEINKKKIEIFNRSVNDIKYISPREMWMMGIVLYWRERYSGKNDNDIKRGVRLSSTDPSIILFFTKWLKDIGKIDKDEIYYDLFLNNSDNKYIEKAKKYWRNKLKIGIDKINHVYIIRNKLSTVIKKRLFKRRSEYGMIRIRIMASTLLARQIAGWIKGIQKHI